MSNELWRDSAHGMAARIRAGEVSSRDVVDAHLARIEAVNPQLNAGTPTSPPPDPAAARHLRSPVA